MADSDSPNATVPAEVAPPHLERADAATLRAVFKLTPTILSITDLETGRVSRRQRRVRPRQRLLARGAPWPLVRELGIWVDHGQREHGLSRPQDGQLVRGWRRAFA